MHEFDRRLDVAIAMNADPRVISPRGTAYAWRPVWGWDYAIQRQRWIWLERVNWFCCLGLTMEYFTYSGSEKEFHDKHGRYSWQQEGLYGRSYDAA